MCVRVCRGTLTKSYITCKRKGNMFFAPVTCVETKFKLRSCTTLRLGAANLSRQASTGDLTVREGVDKSPAEMSELLISLFEPIYIFPF